MGVYYHARSERGLSRAMDSGELKASWDGLVYLCEEPVEAMRFVALRCIGDKDAKVYVFELELDDDKVVETFDHSESFWKCRCYGHTGDVDLRESLLGISSYQPWSEL